MKFNLRKIFIFVVFALLFSCIDVEAKRGCCSWHGGMSGYCRYGKIVCNDGQTSPTCACEGGYDITPKPVEVYGCTDKDSINYNSNANRDDGSCIKKVYGCTDSEAFNYNPNANVDNSTCVAKVYGCMDSKAKNYNSKANIDDENCLYVKKKITYKKIKYKVKYQREFFRKEGKVLKKGKNGKKKITTEVVVDKDGNVIESKIVKTEVIKEAKNKVIATKDKKKLKQNK